MSSTPSPEQQAPSGGGQAAGSGRRLPISARAPAGDWPLRRRLGVHAALIDGIDQLRVVLLV